ncbi:D-alanyl-D-alanine carboxypeptidase [Paenibacillus sp. JGP012]|uniref:M15 family metallopeptidase n=1 Tax=Paenibacillus sp. JGP012 TaxID=2735914 RepID=UPI00160FB31F|nr:M15 family metallopeptidase [Paenibacillus sp. JGP012]MBB6023890.1 D-alanyl-D-alanine carboxypeptidase [Paenibacillus sp. JGP012]
MSSFTRKSIISTMLLGSVLAGTAFTALPMYPSLNPVASAASSSFSQFLHDNAPSRTVTTNSKGVATVTNLSSTVVLVNKKRNLSSTYEPKDLVVPNIPFSFSGSSPKKQMRKVAASAIEKLFAAAKKDGIDIKAVSGYRSYATQKSIFDRNASIKGEAVANKTSARPGQSEHQTGLAMDISSASAGYDLQQSFGNTKEGKWLKANAHKYGFIIRYGKDQEKLTGYSYEPWHVRYVGVYIAGEITSQKLTLEQYLERGK